MPYFLLPLLTGVSNALRLPALVMFISNLAAQLLTWFALKLTRNVAIKLTVITSIIGLAALITASIYAIADALQYIAPPSLSLGFSYFIPDNAVPCLSAIFSAKVVRWVFEWQFYTVDKVSS